MPFKFQLMSDVRGFLQGTQSVRDELSKVADSLDQLATDTAQDADKAASALETKFTDALHTVEAKSRDAGDSVGDNMKRGTKRAEEGMDEMKDSSRQNAIEVAASFDGSAQSIADGFQGLAAEVFAGFGPAGVAAGVAAAAGLGLVSKSLEDASEKAEETKSEIAGIQDELAGVGNSVAKLDYAEHFKQWAAQTTDGRKNIDWLNDATKQLGLDEHTVFMAWKGDAAAKLAVQQAMTTAQNNLAEAQTNATIANGAEDGALRGQQDTLAKSADVLRSFGVMVDTAASNNQTLTRYLGDGTEALKSHSEWAGTATDATKELADALKTDAQKAAGDFSAALTDNLSVADEGLDKFVKHGKLNLKAWAEELKSRRAENATIKDFTVDVAPKLSDAALAAFERLPSETQAQIAKAYGDGKGKKGKQVISNLEAEARVTKVTVEGGGKANAVTIETRIDATAAAVQAAKAANAAQDEADKDEHKITVRTRIDHDDLQRQLNRAVASITPPTITVKTRVGKEVP